MNQRIKRAFLDREDGQILYRMGGEGDPLLLCWFPSAVKADGNYLR